MKIRIEFLKSGQVIKTFDREADNDGAAETLAAQIATDSGIAHDSRRVIKERHCKILLLDAEGKPVELLHSAAFDETAAKAIAGKWAQAAGKTFSSAEVRF